MQTTDLEQTLARLAVNMPKRTKDAESSLSWLVIYLRNLVETGQLPDLESNELLGHLATLRRQFMPAQPKRAKTVWQWVALATNPKDVRQYLHFVHVTGQWLEGCDGHRAHRAPNLDGLEPGFYTIDAVKVYSPYGTNGNSAPWAYPDINRIIPQVNYLKASYKADAQALADMPTKTVGKVTQRQLIPLGDLPDGLALPPEVKVNDQYLRQALSLAEPDHCRNNGENDGVVRLDWHSPGPLQGALAVIMPMRK